MNKKRERPFFVGYLKIPKTLATFLGVFSACFLVGLGLASLALSSTQSDPGDGAFYWNDRLEQVGILELHPYPVFRVAGTADAEPRTYMLSGQGKLGVFEQAHENEGMPVSLRGVPLKRGDLTMIQVGKVDATADGNGDFDPSAAVPMGRWRLTGEICDGKCYSGAMRPGRGLAHKACAELCLTGGIPAVFVSSGNVAGRNFFMLADKDGNLLDDRLSEWIALYMEVEGEVERLDDLMVFKIDLDTAKAIR